LIKNFEEEMQSRGQNVVVTGIYIGVYTNEESDGSYSILVTKKQEFSPIYL
jgi:hypothetical protein